MPTSISFINLQNTTMCFDNVTRCCLAMVSIYNTSSFSTSKRCTLSVNAICYSWPSATCNFSRTERSEEQANKNSFYLLLYRRQLYKNETYTRSEARRASHVSRKVNKGALALPSAERPPCVGDGLLFDAAVRFPISCCFCRFRWLRAETFEWTL